ncbi:MAG: hypothetical protein ACE5G0_05815 [Rhodothermales bacterium]
MRRPYIQIPSAATTKILSGVMLLLLFCAGPSRAQDGRSSKKTHLIFHHGSLSGIGIGASYTLHRTLAVEVIVGAPTFVSVGVGQPFAGNIVNAALTLPVRHASGVYVAPGVHAGYFRMKATDKYNLRFAEETETLLLVRPRMAVGYERANPAKTRRFSFEVGVALLIPERIERDFERRGRTWVFEAERSLRGPFFPFYTVRMKI